MRPNPDGRGTSGNLAVKTFWIVQSKIPALSDTGSNGTPTVLEYGTLQNAYDHFNSALFDGSLPEVLIALQRQRGARGYFCRERFHQRNVPSARVHEVALNPDTFNGRTDEEILSTLAHEMVHVWQQEHGRTRRRGYHNRQWSRKMHSIGLMPSSTGEPGGQPTGDRVSHYIIEDGAFRAACRLFLGRYRLVWESAREWSASQGSVAGGTERAKTQTRAKFTCPNGGHLSVWAKPGAMVDCHQCSVDAGEPVLMEEQQ
jgi:hypothetical protein